MNNIINYRKVIIFTLLFFCLSPIFATYRLNPGKYYICDSNVNIRDNPGLNGRIIGRLNVADEIEVLEWKDSSWPPANIGGLRAFWHKIKHNDIIGYVYGAYIAPKTTIFDIDGNGINEYIFRRKTKFSDGPEFPFMDSRKDIIIYFNNRFIETDIFAIYSSWSFSGIKIDKNGVHIYLSVSNDEDHLFDEIYHFIFTPTGRINFNGIIKTKSLWDYVEHLD
ncbi:hypothetical protein FACS1894130_09160 [Spirochaetia bacterium]|nr:hypothetical protein FACS1894130_09160 [Spirochaetia bacterium]